MTDEPRRPRFPRPSDLKDDDVFDVPATERVPRREPFRKLVATPAEVSREVLELQRKMGLQLDAFGQTVSRRFDIFHQELALMGTRVEQVHAIVTHDHAPRIDKVESSLGKKVARGGGIVGLVLLAAPMIADALPKYRWLIEAVAGALP